jgi:hypothetical protein
VLAPDWWFAQELSGSFGRFVVPRGHRPDTGEGAGEGLRGRTLPLAIHAAADIPIYFYWACRLG